jgi:hypothetical protein
MNTGALAKFNILEMLYRSGFQSDIIERTLDKLISLEKDRVTSELMKLNARLLNFERQYSMSSDVFYQRYENGELDDSADFTEWSSFYDMRRTAEQHLESLAGALK